MAGFGPPAELKAPSSPVVRSLLSVLWIGCLALALYGQAATSLIIYGGAAYGDQLMIVSQFIDVGVAVLLIVAAFLLRLKRFWEPVSVLFSFAFLLLATVGTTLAWEQVSILSPSPAWAELWYRIDAIVSTLWITLMLIAIPALPSGRYVPRWTRWAMVAGPVGGLCLLHPTLSFELKELARGSMLLIALGCVILRFRFTPPGAERQQMKWASLGLAAGLILYGVSNLIWLVMTGEATMYALYELGWYEPLRYVQYGINRLAYPIMAAGVLVCLMDYRLNDADAAIGRSTGYAIITTLIAVIWAISATWINKGIGMVAGEDNPTLSTAISTLVALAVLTPTQKRIMAWTEGRFQRALVQLRELPDRLLRWQHEDDPRPVARATLAAIADGVNALNGAVVAQDAEGRPWVIAAHDIQPDEVLGRLEMPEGEGFGVRMPLMVDADQIGWLLLGGRSDGASYTRDERAAIRMVINPLSDAIRHTARRDQRNAVLVRALEAMETRLAQMEAERDTALRPRAAGSAET